MPNAERAKSLMCIDRDFAATKAESTQGTPTQTHTYTWGHTQLEDSRSNHKDNNGF